MSQEFYNRLVEMAEGLDRAATQEFVKWAEQKFGLDSIASHDILEKIRKHFHHTQIYGDFS